MIDNAGCMEPGDVVGERFVVEARAGSGGMGAVYRARDGDRAVALKVMADDGSDARFGQEARVLAELDHPAIVRYLAHGRTCDGRPYLAMEWLDGEDLGARLARAKLGVDEARTALRRACEALAVAHARGIVHRDIKPRNLFLPDGDPSRLKVLDFGIARMRSGLVDDATVVPTTHTGMVIGTVGYMSPEQARGRRDVDARTDVFALGCVLFECLTGKPAFAGANAIAVLAKVLLEGAPRAREIEPAVPVQLDELVARMLVKELDSRPRDATAVLRALDASEPARSVSSSGGLGDGENRLVTILLARGLERGLDGAVRLGDGAQLVEFDGIDPVTHAAASALELARKHRGASLAIATGRAASPRSGAYGPIIDRVASLDARAGAVAIDGVSAALLGDRFEVKEGLLVGASRAATAPRTLLGKRTPYVGRDKELALLEATFHECVADSVSRGVLVTGAPGTGKSRLMHELLARVRDGATVLVARGDPIGAGSALGLARQLVESAAHLHDLGDARARHDRLRAHLETYFADETLERILEMLGELVDAPSPSPSAELRAARDDARAFAGWLARAFADWIAALSDAGPLLCVVDDLHWGGGASLAYLDDALRANAARPLMVLALARPEVHDLFPSLWTRAELSEIKLQSLTKRAAERLVTSVLGPTDDPTTARIVERSEGNAFHLEELIRHVAAQGADSLPDTVLALAEARLARLEHDARRFLRVASVFGETFWDAGVYELLGHPAPADLLPRLVGAELVVLGDAGEHVRECRFRHGLLRDAAYAMLTDEDRAALHLAAGRWLDRAGRQDALVVAEHFERGGAPSCAAPFLLRATEQAVQSMDFASALTLAERGIRCGAAGEVLGRLRCAEALAAAGTGAHARAATAAKVAYRLLPPQSPHWYVAGAHALASGACVGDVELAPAIIQDLLTTEPERPTAPYGIAIMVACDILDGVGHHEAAERLMDRALELAGASTDSTFCAYVAYGRTALEWRRDRPLGDLMARVAQLTPLVESVRDAVASNLIAFGQGVVCADAGDIASGRRLLLAAHEGAGEAPIFASWCAVHLAWCDIADRQYSGALAWAKKAFALDPRHAFAVAAYAQLASGDSAAAEASIAQALEGIDDAFVTPFVQAIAHAVAARIALAAGRRDDARKLAHLAARCELGPPFVRSLVSMTLIDAVREHGEDVGPLVSAFVERVERHARSLPPRLAESYRRLPDHARLLELGERLRKGGTAA
ncbi:MAG: protein kinase [Sorangiineae bacterium]|nr:protein kinase [Polyangiaceae bacterium]MEB2322863.1 protein kinase [Sorangiineae bacterium]